MTRQWSLRQELAALCACILLSAALGYGWYATYLQRQLWDETRELAQGLSGYLWQFDSFGAQSTLDLLLDPDTIASVSLHDEQGQVFAQATSPDSPGQYSTESPVVHGGRNIGTLHVSWQDRALIYSLLAAGLGTIIGLLALAARRLIVHRTLLQLAQTQRDAAKADDRFKTEFLAAMSHEIRTPLTVIQGNIELLMRRLSPAQAAAYTREVSAIQDAVHRLTETSSKIIDVARLQLNIFPLYPAAIHLSAALQEVLSSARYLAERKGLTLDIGPIPETLQLWIDPYALRHTLANLIENAIKFTHTGYVRIQVHPASEGHVRLTVEDSGIGIEPEVLARLFGLFEQGHRGETRIHEGSGLGLALAKRMMDLSHGSLHIRSTPGRGTTVELIVPLHLESPHA